MDEARRQIIDDIIRDAHEGDRVVASEAAAVVLDELRSLEAGGHRWVAQFMDGLLLRGVARLCADWRRRSSHKGRTRRGAEVEIPEWGAVREATEDGEIVHVQLSLFSMTLDQAKARRDSLSRQRDTLSAEVRWFSDVIEIMEADASLGTVGDALVRLDAA